MTFRSGSDPSAQRTHDAGGSRRQKNGSNRNLYPRRRVRALMRKAHNVDALLAPTRRSSRYVEAMLTISFLIWPID
jgi:hypothetical protein